MLPFIAVFVDLVNRDGMEREHPAIHFAAQAQSIFGTIGVSYHWFSIKRTQFRQTATGVS